MTLRQTSKHFAVGNYIMQPTRSKREGDKNTPSGVGLVLHLISIRGYIRINHIDFQRYGNIRNIL
jgi:hypothetical protein